MLCSNCEFLSRFSQIQELLFREILDDHSTPGDIAMLAAVAKGLAQFENTTDLFLDLTEQLFTNLTTVNKTFTLLDVNDANVSCHYVFINTHSSLFLGVF